MSVIVKLSDVSTELERRIQALLLQEGARVSTVAAATNTSIGIVYYLRRKLIKAGVIHSTRKPRTIRSKATTAATVVTQDSTVSNVLRIKGNVVSYNGISINVTNASNIEINDGALEVKY